MLFGEIASMIDHPMFITSADFKRVYAGVRSEAWCIMWYRNLRIAYSLQQPRHIPTLGQFCEYMMLDEQQVKEKLGWVKSQKNMAVNS